MTGWYVSIIRSSRQRGLLAGPFDAQPSPETVDHFRRKASEVDPWSDFDAFGTVKITADRLPGAVFAPKMGDLFS